MAVRIVGTGDMGRGDASVGRGPRGGPARSRGRRERGVGTVGDAIAGDDVMLAVPYEAAAPLLRQYGGALSGKVVVDIMNPAGRETLDGQATPPGGSAAEIQNGGPAGRKRSEGVEHHLRAHALGGRGGGPATRRVHRRG